MTLQQANEWYDQNTNDGFECGIVYCYTNRVNGKKYVGQTRRRPQIRHDEHCENNHRYGDSTVFHAAVVKYGGIENFDYDILSLVKSMYLYEVIEQLNNDEREYIASQHSLTKEHGYNIATGGGQAAKYFDVKHHIVNMFTMDGVYVKSFNGLSEANREMGITGKGIKNACEKNGATSCGHLWSYDDKEPYIPQKYTVFQYDSNGNFVKAYKHAFDAANTIGARNSVISKALKDKYRKSYNCYWRTSYCEKIEIIYKEPVYQYDKEGNFIKMWPSKSIAYESIFGRRSATLLSRAVRNKLLCANSYWSDVKFEKYPVPAKNEEEIVFQYDGVTHKLIAGYTSSVEAARASGATKTNICNVLHGRRTLANGYIFSREKYDIYPFKNEKELPDTVFQYDGQTGKFVAGYKTMAEAARAMGLVNCCSIMNCLRGNGKMAARSYWSYQKTESVPVIHHRDAEIACKYDENGYFVAEYKNRRAAALAERGNKMLYKPISTAIKNGNTMAYGGYWRTYKTDKIDITK